MPRRSNRESDGSVRPPFAGTEGQASGNLEPRTRDALTGRSPKLTKVVEETVCQAVGAGVPYTTACALAGISRKTAEEWVRRGEGRARGRPSAPRYAAFATALARARAEDETARIARITEAARGGAVVYRRTNRKPDGTVVEEIRQAPPDWEADAWVLERKHPDRWGRQNTVGHSGEWTFDWASMVQDAWDRIRADRAKKVAAPITQPALPGPTDPETPQKLRVLPGGRDEDWAETGPPDGHAE